MTSLKYQLFKAVSIDKDKQSVKLTEAPAILRRDKGKFSVVGKFAVVQADLIYMKPDPNDYHYILTVVDVGTRRMDAEPLRGRTETDIEEGFNEIFKRKNITTQIETLYTDPGTEFKNKAFHEFMNKMGVDVRHTMTGRKNQMGIVEYFNHLITKTLSTKMTSQEIDTKDEFNEWSELLPKIVKVLNDKENLKNPKAKEFFKDPRTTLRQLEDRLKVGDIVHVRLNQPIDHLKEKNNKLHGGFRNGDIRWEQSLTEIVNVLILPDQPIRYLVKKYNNVSFIRKELLLATPEEIQKYTESNKPVEVQQRQEPQQLPESGPITRSMRRKTNQLL